MRKSKRRSKSRRKAYVSDTSFTMCLIDDPLVRNTCVLMVDNIADKDRLAKKEREDGLTLTPADKASGTGKPEGIGLPGGGKNIENLESPQEAAKNEFKQETGLDIIGDPELVFIHGYVYLMDKKSGETVWKKPFEKGQRPSYQMGSNLYDVENCVHVYKGKADWEGSNLQKLFQKEKEYLLEDGFTLEDIDELGIFIEFENLTEEELKSLKIKELDEIKGIGIFPLQYLFDAITDKEKQKGFYFHHLKRIESVIKINKGEEVNTVF